MNAEKISKDKNFVNYVLKNQPRYITSLMTKDELLSELNLVIVLCSNSFNPQLGSFTNFVIKSLKNNLLNNFNRNLAIKSREVSLGEMDFAYEADYTDDNKTLLAFFKTLDAELVGRLIDFTLGKIKKEDINNPPLKLSHEEVDRIIDRIDSMV